MTAATWGFRQLIFETERSNYPVVRWGQNDNGTHQWVNRTGSFERRTISLTFEGSIPLETRSAKVPLKSTWIRDKCDLSWFCSTRLPTKAAQQLGWAFSQFNTMFESVKSYCASVTKFTSGFWQLRPPVYKASRAANISKTRTACVFIGASFDWPLRKAA